MHEHALDTRFLRGAQQRIEMFLVGVHAAVGDQAEEMQLPACFTRPLHGLHYRWILSEFARRNQRVDARDVHLHNAPGTDVQVAHFAVAHLPVGQADKVLRCANQRVGELAQELVVGRFARQSNGIVGCFSAVTPSIEDGQNERMLGRGHVQGP